MTRIIVFSTFLLCALPLCAQWSLMNSNTSERLIDIAFSDSLTGYCTGDNGTVLRSQDAGSTWNSIHTQPGLSLSEIEAATNGNVLVLGRKNGNLYIMYSQDSGNTWQYDSTTYLVPNNQYNLRLNQTGFLFQANGNRIIEWDFSGNSTEVHNGSLAFDVYNDSVIYVLAEDYASILKIDYKNQLQVGSVSNNLGLFNNNQIFFSLNFLDDDIGFLTFTYNPSVYETLDGGNTWWKRDDNDSTIDMYFDAEQCAVLYDSVYMAPSWTSAGIVNLSVDNGVNWYNLQIDSANFLYGMEQVSNTVFVCGANGVIYKIENAGNVLSWKSTDFGLTSFNIYPNPSKGKIQIDVSNHVDVKRIYVLSMDGNVIKKFNGSNTTLNLDSLPVGQYIIQITTKDEKVLSKRLILSE